MIIYYFLVFHSIYTYIFYFSAPPPVGKWGRVVPIVELFSESTRDLSPASQKMHQYKILNFSDENPVSLKVFYRLVYNFLKFKKIFFKKINQSRIKITILILLKECNTS